jgi:hypothetical protein
MSSARQFFFVRNVSGSLRMCIDYRGLNEVARKDAYQLSRVDDTLDELMDANFYTHLDLASADAACCIASVKFEYVMKKSIRLRFKPGWLDGMGRHAVIRIALCPSYVLANDE